MKATKEKVFQISAEVNVRLTQTAADDILYSAFNCGGISGWADKILVCGLKLADKVYKNVTAGGAVNIHCFRDDQWYVFDMEKFSQGIRRYLEEGCHVHIEDGEFPSGEVTANDADVIVQLGIFEGVRY